MPQALPANPDLDWLKKAAKKRLVELRAHAPDAKLHQAQLAVARDHGFASWRALKAHSTTSMAWPADVRASLPPHATATSRRCAAPFEAGFDPATPDRDGRTVYQIAKELRHADIEIAGAAHPGRTALPGGRAGQGPGHHGRRASRRCHSPCRTARCQPGADRRARRTRHRKGHAPVPCRAAQSTWRGPPADRARRRRQQA